ncbi:MAG: hypothetical protein F6K36_13690 [Symploca sp. SIO3C6]|uniref:Uncharacterized protein n=1 Tax=Symploca sp. SIO1C4 TaxID=2607765 RepID=A0A6B3N8H1_9CYAN|nr:hypothetical protein [Symploca sp. SIO3C6]NER26912.1 hypothetical protein [Symploca sp. SIO1C4]NET07163.1 hypothetical protein [Symploca sp. SIO2B6]NET52697.1 hypothetical protein [Merismopedia sp. SIO2A8]
MIGYAPVGTILTANPGDRIADEPQTIEEKAKQMAVDTYDITGERVKVPTYFIVKYPDGETKALHHVRDAKEISDIIRQMHLEEEDTQESGEVKHWLNWVGLFFIMAFALMTTTILVGIF